MYKCLNGSRPAYLTDSLQRVTPAVVLIVNVSRPGDTSWNALPDCVTSAPTVSSFCDEDQICSPELLLTLITHVILLTLWRVPVAPCARTRTTLIWSCDNDHHDDKAYKLPEQVIAGSWVVDWCLSQHARLIKQQKTIITEFVWIKCFCIVICYQKTMNFSTGYIVLTYNTLKCIVFKNRRGRCGRSVVASVCSTYSYHSVVLRTSMHGARRCKTRPQRRS